LGAARRRRARRGDLDGHGAAAARPRDRRAGRGRRHDRGRHGVLDALRRRRGAPQAAAGDRDRLDAGVTARAPMPDHSAVADGTTMLDTRLAGLPGITAAFLVDGPSPALVETGARTSAPALLDALAAEGVGPDDLAWIVLTHVHLDHCGGTGLVAEAFPRARVVVHRRGARHLVSPGRLVAASAEVYGERAPIFGGLDPVAQERIVAAEDGHRVPLGDGRELVMVEALGHARHHMVVLDERTGTVLAGDALG